MRGKLVLDTRANQLRKDGFPVVINLQYKGKKKPCTLGINFFKEDWDFEKVEPKKDKRKILFIRKKKVLLEELLLKSLDDPTLTLDVVSTILKGKNNNIGASNSFYDFAEFLIEELELQKDDKGADKKGNAKVYRNAIKQLKKLQKSLSFSQINYNFLNSFKNWQLRLDNRKSTIHSYLRTYRAIYNEAVKRGMIKDNTPFDDIFKSLPQKRNRNKKKNVSKETIKILESIKGLAQGQQLAVDLWLLQFYFGGQDLKDVYYLENAQIARKRVFFVRGKLDETGYEFDLKIIPKAADILKKYVVDGRFVFPWRKDYEGYETFKRRVQKNLLIVQNKYNEHIDRYSLFCNKEFHKIEILPLGGNLAPKVTRHTFGTLGAHLFVEPDLLRALMGHERDDVDTIYKDVYPEKVRDENHLRIVDTSKIEIELVNVYENTYIDKEDGKRKKRYEYSTNNLDKAEVKELFGGKKFFKSELVVINKYNDNQDI
ncbi:Phage_int_SAM_5 domain-containing protein [Tenacibaculum sp. 190524A02b]|uniref:Phage_int_SAM_5 domain-containing protein n=1 Tax=Tenacibaculum vairaonense TaxID=3137860 RepID=A0ABM9PS34_9FLAO